MVIVKMIILLMRMILQVIENMVARIEIWQSYFNGAEVAILRQL